MKDVLRRLVAGVMLVTVVTSLATPPHASAGAACPEGAGSAGAPALVAAMDHGGCEHPGAGPCLAALGCLSAPPALRPVAGAVFSPLALILTRPAAAPHYADLCRTGPPTPPPNSV